MEHQHLEYYYLYEDEDALSELKELRSQIDYAKKNGEIKKALFLYMDYIECDVFKLYCKDAIKKETAKQRILTTSMKLSGLNKRND